MNHRSIGSSIQVWDKCMIYNDLSTITPLIHQAVMEVLAEDFSDPDSDSPALLESQTLALAAAVADRVRDLHQKTSVAKAGSGSI
jgi:hypothetical protein